MDNRAGAGGNIGAEFAARAPADGYAIVLGTNTHAINMSLYAKPGYDLVKDFAPISLLSSAPLVLMVHPSVPAKNVRDLIALAKASPGKLNYGTGGSGSSAHIATELLKTQTGIDLVHVPYKAWRRRRPTSLEDRFTSCSTHVHGARPHALEARASHRHFFGEALAACARSADRRRIGVPGYEAVIWQGVLAPAATPKTIVDRLHGEIVKALASNEVQKQFNSAGVVPISSTPAEFHAYLTSETAKWARVVKAAGAKVD